MINIFTINSVYNKIYFLNNVKIKTYTYFYITGDSDR